MAAKSGLPLPHRERAREPAPSTLLLLAKAGIHKQRDGRATVTERKLRRVVEEATQPMPYRMVKMRRATRC